MKKIFAIFLAVLCASIAMAQSYVPGHLTVILKDAAMQGMLVQSDGSVILPNATSLNTMNSSNGLIAMRPLSMKAGSPYRFFFDFEFPSTANMDALNSSYASNSFVWWASKIPNGNLESFGASGAANSFSNTHSPLPCGPLYPNDPAFPREWHLDQPNDIDMNLPETWEWTTGNPNIVIAICGGGVAVDTSANGYAYVRNDLARNIWTNPGEIGIDELGRDKRTNGKDDDHNDFVDDIHGWNVLFDNGDVEARYPTPPPGCVTGREEECFYLIGHGTFGAAWASSQIDNTPLDPVVYTRNGWVGIAPNCKIMGLSSVAGPHVRSGYPTEGVWSIIYAYENGATALAYLYGLYGDYLSRFLDSAYAHGMLVTNGFGNAGPSSFDLAPPAINCQLVRQDGTLYPGNPVDSRLEIFSPGDFGSGQSACAVAAVIALMKSINPYLTAPQLRYILLHPTSTTPVPASPVPVGRTDALKAIRNATASPIFKSLTGNDGEHPLLKWDPNPIISIFPLNPVIDQYVIQRKRHYMDELCFQDLAIVPGSATEYIDMQETVGRLPGEHSPPTEYKIRARLNYGTSTIMSVPSNMLSIWTHSNGVGNGDGVGKISSRNTPTQTRLLGNYPNPFNPNTTISFDIGEAGFVSLKVFDLLGQEVATITNGVAIGGHYEVAFDASALASGVYIYRLQAGGFSETRKLILSK